MRGKRAIRIWLTGVLLAILAVSTPGRDGAPSRLAPPEETSPASAAEAQEQHDEGLPTYRRFQPRPVVLSDEQYRALRESVARRCRTGSDDATSLAPWYFHYELGLELQNAGDPQRALDAMILAIDDRADPKLGTRMYGMWFIDYVPYFRIAELHAALENYECARDALELSEKLAEVPVDSTLFEEWSALKSDLDTRAGLMKHAE